MITIDILGKETADEFAVGLGAEPEDIDTEQLFTGAEDMAALINSRDWPPHYADAFRGMTKIVFFVGKVEVDGFMMDRPCCDQDDAVFYWEAEEFLRNMDADVHANTFFHDCWHVVQYQVAGNNYAASRSQQIAREVDAISHQIGVAYTLGCSQAEIRFLEKFRADQQGIADRIDEGVGGVTPHRAGAMDGPG